MNNDELKIIKLLKDAGKMLTPKKELLEKLLLNIDNENVTKEEFPRYNYSMWKFAAPIFLVVLLLVGVFVFKNSSQNAVQPSNQTTETGQTSQNAQIPQIVTAQNADKTLDQADSQINQDMTQLDTDLTVVDATNGKEEDPSSL